MYENSLCTRQSSNERFMVILLNEKCLVRDLNVVESVLLMLGDKDGRDREHKNGKMLYRTKGSIYLKTNVREMEAIKAKKHHQLGGI